MSNWITWDFGCDTCEVVEVELFRRDAVPETLPCELCGGERRRVFAAPNVMRQALPDGTKRFQGIREQRVLQKAARAAKKNLDTKELGKIAHENNKLNKK